MSDPKHNLAEKLKSLQQAYIQALPHRFENILILWDEIKGGSCEMQLISSLHREFHSLVGSGGTYGLPKLSERARSCELLVGPHTTSGESFTQERVKELELLIEELGVLIRDPEIIEPIQIAARR